MSDKFVDRFGNNLKLQSQTSRTSLESENGHGYMSRDNSTHSIRHKSTLPNPSPRLVGIGAGRGDVADEWSRFVPCRFSPSF